MSSRQFRRRDKQNNFPPPPDDSDDDYQPLYTKKSGFSNYAGLEVSSPSQSEHASEPSEEDSKENAAPTKSTGAKKKTFKKKGKEGERKGKAGERKGKGGQVAAEGLDEVERSVKEVNDLLGSPPEPQPAPPKPINQALDVLTVDPKHLNVANEIRKLFGSEEAQPKRGRTQNRALLLRRVLIHPDSKTPVYDFNNSGLSMMKYKDKENRMYFLFNHSEGYQKMHRNFLRKFVVARGSGEIVRYFDEARQKMHVEALLEISDRLFRMEENGVANEIVENVVTFLQYVADPLFILSKNNVRLDYKFMENRPFFVAMLKYVYLLTNRACHRTALEIAKMLLLLDPTDPLALLSIIDILALRAREHEWLIETVKYFDRQREAGLLFNIKFSNSLAHFHVAIKKQLPLDEADELIRDAILAFPNVFIKILECCHVSNPELLKHEIFKPDDPTDWLSGASEPFLIYATMSFPRWNEPEVMSWLLRNATELCKSYDTDLDIQDSAKCWSISRSSLYRVWPKEYMRHISILTPMSKLIIDTSLSSHRVSCAWDPLFHKSVNRYSYSYKYEPPRAAPPAGAAAAAAAAASPVHSQMRSDHHRMTTQVAPPPGCSPVMGSTSEGHSYPYRDVVLMPPEADVTAVRRMYPNATLIPLYEPPRFSPGFGVPFTDWNAMPTGPMFPNCGTDGLPNPNHGVKNQQPSSRDWAFDDLDPAFDHYDYADDVKNFSRDDNDMARALATEGPGETATEGKPNNEKKD